MPELPTFNPEKARQFESSAHLYFKGGRYGEALKLLKEIVEKYEPNNVDAHLMAAQCYIKGKMYDSANKIIDHLHTFHQPIPESLIIQARAYILLRKFQDCENALRNLEMIQRDYKDAVIVKGELLMRTGKQEEAVKTFTSLLERDPGNPEVLYNLALSYFAGKKYHQALSYSDALLKARPGVPRYKYLFDQCVKKLKNELKVNADYSFFRSPWKWFKLIFHDAEIINSLRYESLSITKDAKRETDILYDELTGVLNGTAALSYIPGYYVKRKGILYVGFVDADFFKSFNDIYGHDVGDQVLIVLANLGEKNFPGRFFHLHGEEMAWCFEGNEEDVLRKAEAFRLDVQENATKEANNLIVQKALRYPQGHPQAGDYMTVNYPVHISQGIVIFGEDGNTYETVKIAADHNLYLAKEYGRNCVFLRGVKKSNGARPTNYTKALVKELNLISLNKAETSWWAYEKKIDAKKRAECLEMARNAVKENESLKK